jgi:beta-galactosidase
MCRTAKDQGFNDSQWRQLNLPHDWSIEGEFDEKNPAGTGGGALPGGTGWYRKTFNVPATAKGKLVFIDFDGVYRNSEVWINGHYLGKRPYGYSSFEYDLTRFLNYGSRKTSSPSGSIIPSSRTRAGIPDLVSTATSGSPQLKRSASSTGVPMSRLPR